MHGSFYSDFKFPRLKRVRMEKDFDFTYFFVDFSTVWSSYAEQFNHEGRKQNQIQVHLLMQYATGLLKSMYSVSAYMYSENEILSYYCHKFFESCF